MQVHRLGNLILVLLLAPAAPALAQEDKKEPAGLSEREKDIIDAHTRADLMRLLDRARNSLSREGQGLLKRRVLLQGIQQKADAIINALKDDLDVAAAQKLRDSEEARRQLAKLLAIADDRKLEAEFARFLKDQAVPLEAFTKLQELQSATNASEKCKQGIKQIEAFLHQANVPAVGGDALRSPGTALDRQADQILAGLPGSPTASVSLKEGTATTKDIRAILEALLNAK